LKLESVSTKLRLLERFGVKVQLSPKVSCIIMGKPKQ
jgi:hypothetical protein